MGRKIPDIITEQELLQLLKSTKKQEHKLAYALGFYQALRISEIVGLHIHISRCCNSPVLTEIELSDDNKKRKIMKCSACGKRLLKTDVKRSKTEYKIHPLNPNNINMNTRMITIKNAKGGKDRIIPIAPEIKGSSLLKHLPIKCGRRALEIAFKNLSKKVLNKDMKFHCLRHSSLTHYLNTKKWDIRKLQQFAGHENINTTTLYTHISPQNLLDEMYKELN